MLKTDSYSNITFTNLTNLKNIGLTAPTIGEKKYIHFKEAELLNKNALKNDEYTNKEKQTPVEVCEINENPISQKEEKSGFINRLKSFMHII